MEILTFERLRTMAPPGVLSRPLRPDFHSLLLVTEGEATHAVDFNEFRLRPGSALWIKPGQVQRFGRDPRAGELVLFRDDFLFPQTLTADFGRERHGLFATTTSGKARQRFEGSRRALRREYANATRSNLPDAVMSERLRHLLSVLILSLDAAGAPRPEPAGAAQTDARFRELLEHDFSTAHDVGHYADRLGYSSRTLNRATRAVTGETPKQVIDRRIVLEARRLLAHSNHSIAVIARELGFSDPSNFSTFFVRRTGAAPRTFRAGEK